MWKSIPKVSIGKHEVHLHPADKLNMWKTYFIVWSERYFNKEVITSDVFTSQIYKLENQSMKSPDLQTKQNKNKLIKKKPHLHKEILFKNLWSYWNFKNFCVKVKECYMTRLWRISIYNC